MSLGSHLLSRLKERKLVQWVLAYLGGAWVLFEVSDVAIDADRGQQPGAEYFSR